MGNHANIIWNFGNGGATHATYLAEVLADSPLIFYRFGEASGTVAANLGTLGAGSNGLYQGTLTQGVAGPLVGDATTATYLAPAGGNVKFDSTAISALGDFSIEAFVKPDASQGSYAAVLAFNSNFGLFLHGGAFIFYQGGLQLTGSAWTSGVYQYLVYTRVGTTGTFYLNGSSVASGVVSAADPTHGADSYFGTDNAGEIYVGVVSNGAVYGAGLSAARVLAHYNAAIS